MIHYERSLTIDATPDALWQVLSRYMYIDEFAPQITSADALTDGEVGVGSKRRNNFANGTSVVEEVTTWKPGRGVHCAALRYGGNAVARGKCRNPHHANRWQIQGFG
ncbi:MAG: SRPBCC family protein [Pelagimonas sp.]|jgi:hypothetical protein|nr:SRPBCC family protein [Pelagimonas sp.]